MTERTSASGPVQAGKRERTRKDMPKEGYRLFYKLAGVLLIVFLAVTVLAFLLTPEKAYSAAEKRNLAERPVLTAESLSSGKFMEGIEDYTADQFPFRDFWMKLKTGISRRIGICESQGVYLLKNGGLAERFDAPDEENFTETTDTIRAFCERYPDTAMYFLLAPTAVSVLSDTLPANAVTEDQNTYMDRLFEALPERMTAIDVRQAFQNAADRTALYYRTDHHWTTDGALLAYETAKPLLGISGSTTYNGGTASNRFLGSLVSKSGFTVDPPDELKIYLPENLPDSFLYTVNYPEEMRRTASVYDLDALNSDDPYTVFFGSNHPLIEIDTTADSDRKLLVIKDSYANCFVPFLLPEFQKIDLLDARYYYDDIDVLMQSRNYTDVLFLYNANTFAADTSLKTVLINRQ